MCEWLNVSAKSHLQTELIAPGLTQDELCHADLHRVDDGEAAVPALVWQHHGEAALRTLRHDVAGCTPTHTHRHTDTQEKAFQTNSSPSAEKLITDTSGRKLDVIGADCRKETHIRGEHGNPI